MHQSTNVHSTLLDTVIGISFMMHLTMGAVAATKSNSIMKLIPEELKSNDFLQAVEAAKVTLGCGPSVARMMRVENKEVHRSNSGWSRVYARDNLAVMSVAFMLQSKTDAIIWRGPRKNGLIKQFLTDVEWNALDFLMIDGMSHHSHSPLPSHPCTIEDEELHSEPKVPL